MRFYECEDFAILGTDAEEFSIGGAIMASQQLFDLQAKHFGFFFESEKEKFAVHTRMPLDTKLNLEVLMYMLDCLNEYGSDVDDQDELSDMTKAKEYYCSEFNKVEEIVMFVNLFKLNNFKIIEMDSKYYLCTSKFMVIWTEYKTFFSISLLRLTYLREHGNVICDGGNDFEQLKQIVGGIR